MSFETCAWCGHEWENPSRHFDNGRPCPAEAYHWEQLRREELRGILLPYLCSHPGSTLLELHAQAQGLITTRLVMLAELRTLFRKEIGRGFALAEKAGRKNSYFAVYGPAEICACGDRAQLAYGDKRFSCCGAPCCGPYCADAHFSGGPCKVRFKKRG